MKLLSIFRMIFSAIAKPKQHILIREIPKGKVIDIGGGGDGVIAQAGGARVAAIDKHISEIHEARGKAPMFHGWLLMQPNCPVKVIVLIMRRCFQFNVHVGR